MLGYTKLGCEPELRIDRIAYTSYDLLTKSEEKAKDGFKQFFKEEKISADLVSDFKKKLEQLGVPDRYVNVLQGRAPVTVLQKHYTGTELKRLRLIYDKAGLRVLC